MHRFIILLLSLLSFQISAQSFPDLATENLKGADVQLPKELKGKKSIVFMAFTEDAEKQLSRWYGPVYTLFLDPNGFNAMAYDCHVKLIMMFTGPAQSMAQAIMKKIRKSVSADMDDYLLFYTGSIKDEMKAMGLSKKNDAYVIVLDESGKIIYTESGKYSEAKIEKIASLVEL